MYTVFTFDVDNLNMQRRDLFIYLFIFSYDCTSWRNNQFW